MTINGHGGFFTNPSNFEFRIKLHEIQFHFYEVSYSIKLAAPAARGGADT
jgi:hypothetical protein